MEHKNQAAWVGRELITKDTSVGLGDGVTIRLLASYLKESVDNGLNIKLYTSSIQTEQFLQQLGIRTFDVGLTDSLDLYFDGCDQIDFHLNVLKSGSGIHTNEKLLAAMAKKFIILADESKFVSKLDSKFPLVIELLPQATSFVQKNLKNLFPGATQRIRTSDRDQKPVITRNGNYLIDCFFPLWPDLEPLQNRCRNITGVIEISLFYKMTSGAIIAGDNGIIRYERRGDVVSIIN
jgi:ribose 5-phosphate isomerase A